MDRKNFEQAKQYALDRLERELSPGLVYHGIAHTREDVTPAVELLASMEGIIDESIFMLLTAAWFHDLGFIKVQAGHEAIGAQLASESLPGFGYTEGQIQIVRGIIMATVVPQSPLTILEKIMADADLDGLGRADFMLFNAKLRREVAFFGQEFTDAEWFSEQLKFVETHAYFTPSARALRDAGQLKNVAALKRKLEELE